MSVSKSRRYVRVSKFMRSKPEVMDLVRGLAAQTYSSNEVNITLGMVHLENNVLYTLDTTQCCLCIQAADAKFKNRNKSEPFDGKKFYG